MVVFLTPCLRRIQSSFFSKMLTLKDKRGKSQRKWPEFISSNETDFGSLDPNALGSKKKPLVVATKKSDKRGEGKGMSLRER